MTDGGGFLRVRNWEKYQRNKTGDRSDAERKAAGKAPLPWLVVHHRYLDDFDLMSLSLETRAISLMFLMLARRTFNQIPDDPARLAFWFKCSKVNITRSIGELLEVGWLQRVVQTGTRRDTELSRIGAYSDSDSDSDSDRDKEHCPPGGERRVQFEHFWTAYPRKTAKKRAKEAWSRLKVTEDRWQTMLAALEVQKDSEQWQDPRLIPHPATWLNGHRWEDEPPEDAGGYFTPIVVGG